MSEFKNQLNHFIVNNNLISIAAGVSIGLVTKDAVVSLVGDIIIPIIVILLKTIKNKKIIKFLPVKSELNIILFIKQLFSFVLIVIFTFIFIQFFMNSIGGDTKK